METERKVIVKKVKGKRIAEKEKLASVLYQGCVLETFLAA